MYKIFEDGIAMVEGHLNQEGNRYSVVLSHINALDELSENNLQAKKSFLNFDFSDTIEIHANMLVVLEMIKNYQKVEKYSSFTENSTF